MSNATAKEDEESAAMSSRSKRGLLGSSVSEHKRAAGSNRAPALWQQPTAAALLRSTRPGRSQASSCGSRLDIASLRAPAPSTHFPRVLVYSG